MHRNISKVNQDKIYKNTRKFSALDRIELDIYSLLATRLHYLQLEELINKKDRQPKGHNGAERAAAGVGLIVHKDIEHYIEEWHAYSERILTVNMKMNNNSSVCPKRRRSDSKEGYVLGRITNNNKTYVVPMGDFNSRVESDHITYNKKIGKFGESVCNNNGKRLLDFCLINNLAIANTFFQHKDVHRYTRQMFSRNEVSIIDYILIEQQKMRNITNVRVMRGPTIGSDHYLLVATMKENKNVIIGV